MNTADRLFAARLYAATYFVQHGRQPGTWDLAKARGLGWADAHNISHGIDYAGITERIDEHRRAG